MKLKKLKFTIRWFLVWLVVVIFVLYMISFAFVTFGADRITPVHFYRAFLLGFPYFVSISIGMALGYTIHGGKPMSISFEEMDQMEWQEMRRIGDNFHSPGQQQQITGSIPGKFLPGGDK